jgi:hypothetical protein
LLASQCHLAGIGVNFPLQQLLVPLGHPLRRLLALGTTWRLLVRRPHRTIGCGMPFKKKGRDFLAQSACQSFPLDERYQFILIALSKHPLESYTRDLKELLTQRFPVLAAQI